MDKKKKKESLRLSIEKLENNLVLAKAEGNTRQARAVEKCLERLYLELKKLKDM